MKTKRKVSLPEDIEQKALNELLSRMCDRYGLGMVANAINNHETSLGHVGVSLVKMLKREK